MAEIRLIKNPFDRKCDLLTINFGDNIQRIVDALDMPQDYKDRLVVNRLDKNLDNPVEIKREDWATTFPKDEEYFQFIVKLNGGGGRGGGKSAITMIAMAAILTIATAGAGLAASAAFSAAFSTATTTVAASSLAGAAIAGVAGMAVYGITYAATFALIAGVGMALIPAPSQQNTSGYSGDTKRTLTGSSNQMSPYGVVPRIYGKTRFSPYKVAPDYTEEVGDDTYLRCLLCFGYGPLKISDLKIGTDDIATYSDVEYEIREGWPDDEPLTLYTDTITTNSYSMQIRADNPPTILTTRANIDEATVVIQFPTGLWAVTRSGTVNLNLSAGIDVKYRKKGDEKWIDGDSKTFSYHTQKPFTKTLRVEFPERGTYELAISKSGGDRNDSTGVNEAFLTAVQYMTYKAPILAKGMALMALRIKATDQLNGTVNGISALCESYERVPDSDTSESEKDESGVIHSVSINRNMGSIGNAKGSSVTYEFSEPIQNASIDFRFKDGMYGERSNSTAYSTFKYTWTADEGSGEGSFEVSGNSSKEMSVIKTIPSETPLTNLKITITRTEAYIRYLVKKFKGKRWVTRNGGVIGICVPRLKGSVQRDEEYSEENRGFSWKLNRHPAWHVYDMLTGTAAVTPISKDLIDVDSFIAWEKEYPDWYVDKAIDGGFTRLECINNMCSAGKALFTNINGKYTIVLDKAGKSPVAAISPRNSFGFSFSKSFEAELHAFKVKYIEPERDWTEQEVVVYAPGYNSENATNYEALDSYGCTNRELAWKWGKFMLSQYILRPETYTVSQDIENLIVNLGDLVLLTHDVLKIGLGSARIKRVYRDESNRITSLWLDDFFDLPHDKSWTIIVRNNFGKFDSIAINGNEKSSDTVELLNPINASINDGDLIVIGETDRVSLRALVTKIEPGDDLTATLTLVPEAPEIHDESDEEIPPFDPMMSDEVSFGNITPMKPIVSNIIADERSLWQDLSGSWEAGIAFYVTSQEGEKADIERIQVFYQEKFSPFMQKVDFSYTGNDHCILKNVKDTEGENNYNIRVRYVTRLGLVSEWNEFETNVIGRQTPPPNIENLDRQGYNITWNYPNKPKDFAGFRVYYNHGFNTNKDEAVRAHTESLWDSPPFTTATLPKEVLTLFVVAVDNVGNESEVPAIITFFNGDVEYDNILWEYDYGLNNFPGRQDGAYDFDHKLYANEKSLFYGDDASRFYKEDPEKFYSDVSFEDVEYHFNIEYDGDIENAYIKLDYDIQGVYKIYYKRESHDLFYKDAEVPFYNAPEEEFYPQTEHWYLFPDKLLIGKERVEVKIVIQGGQTQGIINKLIAKIDAPDVSETISNVFISEKGTRLPVTKGFKVINKVFLTLFGDGNAVSYRVVDYNVEGPMIACYDSQGNMVQALIDADVRGYK